MGSRQRGEGEGDHVKRPCNSSWGLKGWRNNVRQSCTEALSSELNDSMIRPKRKAEVRAQHMAKA